MESGYRTGRPVKTTERSFEILRLLKDEDGLSLGEIADEMEMSMSTTHRHVSTLESIGCVVKDGDQYNISLWFLTYGTYSRKRTKLYRVGKEYADKLAETTRETVWIDAREGPSAVVMYKASGESLFQSYADVGMRFYLNQMAGGKAILASLERSEVEKILDTYGLPPKTENTITVREELLAELEEIREQGYATDCEESVPGVNAIASPIEGDDRVFGSLAITGSVDRLDRKTLENDLAEMVIEATNEIEYGLDWPSQT